ncbi:ACB 4-hydroxyacetophenone monooxygenase [Echria macrotheca]|uniref:ACB 4-hydroxyacetophenone monooxygenase n=1 Tax=Echria macrotheca TaxID=438768 RepID=A0AAJ0B271_9PEZI|nr:ACB 4-hydroxyacetophenone monooxygenase [Echria macrotheca]
MAVPSDKEADSYSQFACIGAGFSGICLGATLKRWHDITDVRIFERESDLGGTWVINQYPGCACDIPTALYSYSFEPNPSWTTVLPARADIHAYLRKVADKYGVADKISFGTEVQRCEWIEDRNRWRIHVRDVASDSSSIHESQFLFSGAGFIFKPRDLDVPGVETFHGPVVHSARWDPRLDLTDKNVVVIGNGCSACQIVPAIVDKVKSLTQVFRSKHWIVPPLDYTYPLGILAFMNQYAPWTKGIQRFLITLATEAEYFSGAYHMKEWSAWARRMYERAATKYIKTTAPEKYHDLLIPDFEIGCRRRIYDGGYLASLYSDKITLTNEPILEVVPEGIRTRNGVTKADVIILANGFQTNKFMVGIDVAGRDGEDIHEHWDKLGGTVAYNSAAVSNFPNFFLVCGPNSGTGHTSLTLAIENEINFALRIIKPVLDGKASSVELKAEAEKKYDQSQQDSLGKMVWNAGCANWYLDPNAGPEAKRNGMMYPWWQQYMWYRSVFPTWGDWTLKVSFLRE